MGVSFPLLCYWPTFLYHHHRLNSTFEDHRLQNKTLHPISVFKKIDLNDCLRSIIELPVCFPILQLFVLDKFKWEPTHDISSFQIWTNSCSDCLVLAVNMEIPYINAIRMIIHDRVHTEHNVKEVVEWTLNAHRGKFALCKIVQGSIGCGILYKCFTHHTSWFFYRRFSTSILAVQIAATVTNC